MIQRSNLIISLGERIRTLRKQKKFTLLTLATTCDISEKHLGQIERGKSNATIDLLEKIAAALDVPTYALLISYTDSIANDVVASPNKIDDKEITSALQHIIENANGEVLQRIYRVVKACQN